jgi:hypothetical protein
MIELTRFAEMVEAEEERINARKAAVKAKQQETVAERKENDAAEKKETAKAEKKSS